MARSDFISKSDLDFRTQLLTFKSKIADSAAALGLTPAQVAAQAADTDYFNYVLACQQMMLNTSKTWTVCKDLVRDGGAAAVDVSELAAPVLPKPVPAVLPGVERRFRALVRQIKASANYTESLGKGLGIEAVDRVAPDFATLRPVLTLAVTGDHVTVGWDWQGHRAFLDQCELQVDRGDGKGFVLLTQSTIPGYQDKTPFPAAPVKWFYRGSYRVADARVGQWSNVPGVTVPP